MPAAGPLVALTNILTSPMEAFRALREKPTVLFPMALIIAANVAAILCYYNTVDYPWLVDTLVQTAVDSSDGELPAEAQEQMRKGLSSMSPAVMSGVSAISIAIILPLIFCLSALYFLIISAITNDGFKFKDWLSLISWSYIPNVFAGLATVVNILMSSNGQLSPYRMNPLSFTSLLSLDAEGQNALASILSNVDITVLWALALLVLGYGQWTGRGLAGSAAIVLAPSVLIITCILLIV